MILEEFVFGLNYLGEDQQSFTINFSKGSSQILAQYCELVQIVGYIPSTDTFRSIH